MSFPLILSVILSLFATGCSDDNLDDDSEQPLKLHVPSPDWREQVIYFLMIDRFNDGDPGNNDQGVGEYRPELDTHFSGGDIEGIIQQLDYIQNIGATAVWLTPPVANQWINPTSTTTGYHGYWAINFSEVDSHYGNIAAYQKLSDQLHRRGMYLVQDIVVNHTGNFSSYQGEYDAEETAKSFTLLRKPGDLQSVPTQSPFDKINRLNPDHVRADIYHWTPSIEDYSIDWLQHSYQLSDLDDINTENPAVMDAFKTIYGNWIRKVGVDGFRIDTVRYVDHEFFSHFLHDKDGIHAVAKETGRQQFLNFGEVFETSKPMENSGEKKVAAYLGSADAPELDSVISFPLHLDLKKVFAGGRPPAELQYRLLQHMQMYRDPYLTPTFVDNHDMSRFLDSGDTDGLKQALTTIFTIPGIPVIYQGTGQAMHETRQAMFAGGYGADKDYFDQQHEMYRFIRMLTQLRSSERIFTRGTMHVIGADATGPGLLAYVREHEGSRVLIMFNTANHPILVSDLDVGVNTPSALKSLMGEQNITSLSSSGKLTKILPARAIEVAEIVENEGFQSNDAGNTPVIILPESVSQPLSGDVVLTGQANPGEALLLVKNGNLKTARPISVDDSGKWQVSYKIRNLGREQFSLQAYSPERNLASNRLSLESLVDSAEYSLHVDDPANDDYGLDGYTLPPLHKQRIGQMDILAADIEVAGEVLQLTLTMRELSDDWLPLYGFDNVALSIFIDNPERQGLTDLPKLSAVMPDDWRWDVGHVVYGWGNTAFDSSEASADQFGRRLGVAPHVVADASQKKIVITYRRTDLDISDWDGVNLYITTWDITGEGAYREISREPGEWEFGNSQRSTSKILDSLKAEIHFAE